MEDTGWMKLLEAVKKIKPEKNSLDKTEKLRGINIGKRGTNE
jgi:hypothetical protein